MNVYYTYELIDSRTNLVFYVGKGKNKRMYWHYHSIKNNVKTKNTNPKLRNKILSIIKNGGSVLYNKIIANDEQSAFNKEIELIKYHKENGINLCNLTNGGEGISGFTYKHTQETKDIISNALKDKPKSEEHKKQLSLSKLEKPTKYWLNKEFSNDHKEKLSISAKNKPAVTQETKDKISLNNKSYLTKGKSHKELYGDEKALLMAKMNSEKHKGKKYSDIINKKKALFNENHPKAKNYIIDNDGIITNIKTTLQSLSIKLNLKVCRIRHMIKNNLRHNNILITIKTNE